MNVATSFASIGFYIETPLLILYKSLCSLRAFSFPTIIMGQRHQAFIIARVVAHGDTKAYYRCLGAIHHQWYATETILPLVLMIPACRCYGLLPLRAVDRFLTLAKNPINAVIIREEIKSVQGQYGRNAEPKIPDVPLPYSIFLLSSAFNCDFEESYISGGPFEHGLLSARMGCWDGGLYLPMPSSPTKM